MVVNTGQTIWQRGFFDHVLRNDESYAEKWQYVVLNPVRKGFVSRHEDWPYAGEVVVIDRS
jgi:putative transposase